MTTPTYPTIVSKPTQTFQFPADFKFSSGHSVLDTQVATVVSNFNKCMAAKRPDIAYALIFSIQSVGYLSVAALSQALHAGGTWTAEDGKNFEVLTGEFSNESGPKDFLTEFKALGLQNLHAPLFGRHPK